MARDELSLLDCGPNSSSKPSADKTDAYTSDAVDLLLDLVEEHRENVNSCSRDTASTTAKKRTWDLIESDINADGRSDKRRTAEQLNKKWKNLKQAAKGASAKDLQQRVATGGGPMQAKAMTATLERVMSIAGDNVLPFSNPFDGDAGHHDGHENDYASGSHAKETAATSVTDCTAVAEAKQDHRFMFAKRSKQRQQVSQVEAEMKSQVADMRLTEHVKRMSVMAAEETFWMTATAAIGECRDAIVGLCSRFTIDGHAASAYEPPSHTYTHL